MMVCLIFHTAIIINRKNWRITMKIHFENLSIFFLKNERTQMLGPPIPTPLLFVFVRFSMTFMIFILLSNSPLGWKSSNFNCIPH